MEEELKKKRRKSRYSHLEQEITKWGVERCASAVVISSCVRAQTLPERLRPNKLIEILINKPNDINILRSSIEGIADWVVQREIFFPFEDLCSALIGFEPDSQAYVLLDCTGVECSDYLRDL